MINLMPQIRSWWLLCLAAIITMTIVTASQLFTHRIARLLDLQASELLAADLVVTSNEAIPAQMLQQARQRGLQIATSVELRSAIFLNDEPRLVEVKAVSPEYPLRGKLERRTGVTDAPQIMQRGPAPGEVWVDNKLAEQLNQTLELGYSQLPATWLLSYEPDRGGSLFNLAPRVMMHLDDLEATGLVVPGSRARFKLLVAGSEEAVKAFADEIKSSLDQGQRLQTLANARPEMRQALARTDRFFSLAIIMTLVIAMVAIAITARYSASREATKVSVMRSFGISGRRLMRYYLAQVLKVWLWALVPGLLLGLAAQYPIQWALGLWFSTSLPAATWPPFALAAAVGLVSLIGFCLPPLVRVIDTPPMRVLRELSQGAGDRRSWMLNLTSMATLFAVLVLIVPDFEMAAWLFGGIMLIAAFIPAVLRLFLYLFGRFGRRRFWLKFYLLSRVLSPNRNALFVMSGFALTLLSVLLIAQVKDRLIDDWQTNLPTDMPNYFLVNIPTDKVQQLADFLAEKEIEASSPYALVRARLQAINGSNVQDIEFASDRAYRLVNHTFNISYTETLPPDNAIVEGQWLGQHDDSNEFSVEADMARDMGLNLGDRLQFKVAGETFESTVTSLRSVVWENFSPNFYLIGSEQQLRDKPQTWLLSALVREDQKQWLKPMVRQFPSVTLLDISEVMQRVRGIIDRASIALQFFFAFAMMAAVIVLMSALNTANPDRQREIALLIALGAGGRQKLSSQLFEFLLMGVLVGLFAALFATLTANFIGFRFFDLPLSLQPQMWIYSVSSAVLFIAGFGMLFIYRSFESTPMKLLRS